MTSWRLSGNSKISLKQKLLTKNEFNFTNKFLWKLPEINSKFKSISPVFSPSHQRERRGSSIRKQVTVSACDESEIMNELKLPEKKLEDKFPRFFVEGTQKICNKQYFRKSFMNKIIVPKQTPQKTKKVVACNDTELDAWDINY